MAAFTKARFNEMMENLEHKDLKTAYTIPVMLSKDDKFQSSDDRSELSPRITQSTDDINLQSRCRLCAHVNKCMIDIFGFDAASQNIPSMIHLCLPIMVNEMDALPKQVCLHCLGELERCYRFHQAVAKADEQLLVFERLAYGNRGATDGNWETSPPCDGQHGPTGGTLKRNSDIEMSSGKSTNSLEKDPTADTAETKNVLSSSLRPSTVVSSITTNSQKNDSSAKKDKENLTDPKYLNPDATTEAFDIGTTTASQTVQQSTCDSEVISAACSRSEADARQEKKADHKVDSAIHKWSGVGEWRYRCTTCAKKFNSKSNLVRHNQLHSDIRELYRCNLCSKIFKTKNGLSGHQQLHTRDGLYRCNLCSKMFKSKSSLSGHHELHTRSGHYRCNLCSKMFKSKKGLSGHQELHTRGGLYRCNLCSKMFESKKGLSGHQELHTRGGLYSCKNCERRFHANEDRKRHHCIHTG